MRGTFARWRRRPLARHELAAQFSCLCLSPSFTSVVSFQPFIHSFVLCWAVVPWQLFAAGCKGPIGSLPGADCRRGWLDIVTGGKGQLLRGSGFTRSDVSVEYSAVGGQRQSKCQLNLASSMVFFFGFFDSRKASFASCHFGTRIHHVANKYQSHD